MSNGWSNETAVPDEMSGFPGDINWSISTTPRFFSHSLTFRPDPAAVSMRSGTVLLWRFRSDWQHLGKANGYAILSPSEVARIRSFPTPALARRFAVARASLRAVASGMTGSPGTAIRVREDADGHCNVISDTGNFMITSAHAGVWILVAASTAQVGLSISSLVRITPGETVYSGADIPDPDRSEPPRSHVRWSSLCRVAGSATPARTASAFETRHSSIMLDSPAGKCWNLLDLPMPGTTLAAMSVAEPVRTVHGFGFFKRECETTN